jgi:hypothetical protein
MTLVAPLLALLVSLALPATAQAQQLGLRLLGEFIYPSATRYEGTLVTELSGLVFDARRNLYYAVSDDRSENRARFYTLAIDIGATGIRDVRVTGVTTLDGNATIPGIQPYELNDADLEEIVLLPDGQVILSSERDRNNAPWLRRYAIDGTLLSELPLPLAFRPAEGKGVRRNLAFEGMTLTPDGTTLYLANEDALAQDGPITTFDAGSQVRILRYDLRGGVWLPGPQVVYRTERIFARPSPPDGPADNGVSGLLWVRHVLPQYDLIVMERSFVAGRGNDVNLYGVTLAGADDVSELDALPVPFAGQPVRKTLLANITRAGATPDNLESIAFGPRLPNGRPSLILMADDNASSTQRNQFLLFEIGGPSGLPATGDGSGSVAGSASSGAEALPLGAAGGSLALAAGGLALGGAVVRRRRARPV